MKARAQYFPLKCRRGEVQVVQWKVQVKHCASGIEKECNPLFSTTNSLVQILKTVHSDIKTLLLICLLWVGDSVRGTHWGVYCLGVFLLLAPLASQCAMSHTQTPTPTPSTPPPPYPVFSDHLTGQLLYPSFHYGLLCLYPRFRKLLWGNDLFLFFQLFLLSYSHIVPFKKVIILT